MFKHGYAHNPKHRRLSKKQLRVRAAEHGWSMEEEVRRILQQALSASRGKKGLGSRIHKAVMTISGPIDLDLKH